MNTLTTAVNFFKTWAVIFLLNSNTTEALATTVNPDLKNIPIETPVMNDLLIKNTEGIVDTFDPKKSEKKYKDEKTVLETNITLLKRGLEQKKKEYLEQKAIMKENMYQDSVDIVLVLDSVSAYKSKLNRILASMDGYKERKEKLEEFSKEIEAKWDRGGKKKTEDLETYNINRKEYDQIPEKVQKLKNDYDTQYPIYINMKDRSTVMVKNYNDKRKELFNSEKEIEVLKQEIYAKEEELKDIKFNIEHYERFKRNAKAKK